MPHHSFASRLRLGITALAAFVSIALAPDVARAAVAQWIGGSSGIWSNAAGWSGGVVPNNTSSTTYLATVAQTVGQYANVTMTNTTPVVELDQLMIRPTATVTVGSASTLRLHDLGAGTSLQRSLVGGGTLYLNGNLNVAVAGGVISGSANIQMIGGRIAGSGRIENARTITGYGTIGNDIGMSDANLGIFNIGATGADPSLIRITALSTGQTLTLGPSASSPGIINNYATLSSDSGGTLDIRGNGSTLDNSNGLIQATGTSSQVRLLAGANVLNENGTINGAGTIRVPAGESATIRANTAGYIGGRSFVAEGNLTLQKQTSGGDLQIWNTLNASGVSAGGYVLMKADRDARHQFQIALHPHRPVGRRRHGHQRRHREQRLDRSNLCREAADALDDQRRPVADGNGHAGVLRLRRNALRRQAGRDVDRERHREHEARLNVRINDGRERERLDAGRCVRHQRHAQTARSVERRVDHWHRRPHPVRHVDHDQRPTSLARRRRSHDDRRLRQFAADEPDDPGRRCAGHACATCPRKRHHHGARNAERVRRCRPTAQTGAKVVGIAQGSSLGTGTFMFNGELVSATSIVLLPTLPGDANLDRSVNFSDLVKLAQNYNRTGGTLWTDGDSNYDGAVNFADLVRLAQNYSGSASLAGVTAASADFAADWALARSLVPEPTAGLLLAIGLLGMRRHRDAMG